jgi:serine/threonine protein kinase
VVRTEKPSFGTFYLVTDTPPGRLPLPVVPGLTDLSVFARGGYATVYRATQLSVGREVAVKVENRTLDTERDQRRFLREARAAGRMSSHPHVVDLFDAGVTADQHPYLIMELCDGSYADRMKTSPLTAIEARDIGVKIADALADAHQLGVLHRDVKPANILYSRFGEPALADFGLAVLAEARDSSVTLEVLTPAYAAPEMFRHSVPSPAVDVYALCATLYAIMRGKPPRWRDDRNPSLITLMELFTEPVPDLPDVPPGFMELLRRGMANEPSARPSAEELRDSLAALVIETGRGGGPPPATPTSGAGPVYGHPSPSFPVSGAPTSGGPSPSGVYVSRSYSPPSASSPASGPPGPPHHGGRVDNTPTVPGAPRRRRHRWWFGGLGVLAVIVLAVGATWAITALGDDDDVTGGGPTPSPTVSIASRVLPGCQLPLPAGGRCPDDVECFGPVDDSGGAVRAARIPCAGRHTWETFAVGDLPASVTAVDHDTVRKVPAVRQVCAEASFTAVTLMMSAKGWEFEVLPPDAAAFAAGDRIFRCLAGKGTDQLTGPTLAK